MPSRSAVAARGLLLISLACAAHGNQYDVFFHQYRPPSECSDGCARWADVVADGVTGIGQDQVDALFAHGSVPAEAGASCLWPGAAPVHGENRRLLTAGDPYAGDSWLWVQAGRAPGPENGSVPFCYCRQAAPGAQRSGHCTPPMGVPEQINLQYASPNTVVAAFVTFETEPPTAPPTASFGQQGETPIELKGISHWYSLPGDPNASSIDVSARTRNYTMSFVKFSGLKPSTKVRTAAISAAPALCHPNSDRTNIGHSTRTRSGVGIAPGRPSLRSAQSGPPARAPASRVTGTWA